ncbi:MAG: hypothetical protein ABIC04_00785 [Nanoarchaeota archaeon]
MVIKKAKEKSDNGSGKISKNKIIKNPSTHKHTFSIIIVVVTLIVITAYVFRKEIFGNVPIYPFFGILALVCIILVHRIIVHFAKKENKPPVKNNKAVKNKETAEKNTTNTQLDIKINKKTIGSVILFLFSVALMGVAYIYKNKIAMLASVTIIVIFVIKHKLSKSLKMDSKKIHKNKATVVSELPKDYKVEIGIHETELDAICKIVEQKERIKLSAIAKFYGVDNKKVEEWVKILEEHKLVEMYYPVIGKPELRKCKK